MLLSYNKCAKIENKGLNKFFNGLNSNSKVYGTAYLIFIKKNESVKNSCDVKDPKKTLF